MLAAMSNQTEATLTSAVITVAILAYLVSRQILVRPLRTNFGLSAVLVIIGIVVLSSEGHSGLSSLGRDLILGALLVFDAAGLGAVRALTVRLWRSGGVVLRQGTWVTMVLWVVGAGVHALVGALANISDSTLLIYLGVTLAAQQLVLQARVQGSQLPERGPAGTQWQGY